MQVPLRSAYCVSMCQSKRLQDSSRFYVSFGLLGAPPASALGRMPQLPFESPPPAHRRRRRRHRRRPPPPPTGGSLT